VYTAPAAICLRPNIVNTFPDYTQSAAFGFKGALSQATDCLKAPSDRPLRLPRCAARSARCVERCNTNYGLALGLRDYQSAFCSRKNSLSSKPFVIFHLCQPPPCKDECHEQFAAVGSKVRGGDLSRPHKCELAILRCVLGFLTFNV
jgi:hypothetical protein